jgi:histidine triad (HIT) family protein
MKAYDNENVFAKILRSELPCHKIYEDDKTLAFMDLMPRTNGHCLVIPKSPARNILDIAPDDLAYLSSIVQKIARASMKAFDADGLSLQQFNETAGGQVVFHLHVHILPRYHGEDLKPHTGQMAPAELLKSNAEKLRFEIDSIK